MVKYGIIINKKIRMKGLIGIKKIIISFILVLSAALTLTGCDFPLMPEEPPQVTITINDKELEYVIGKNQWNGKDYDREDTFKRILEAGSEIEVPYIEIGSMVTIQFNNNPPIEFNVYDILIDEYGDNMYTNMEAVKIPVKLDNGKCSFEINKHPATALSSTYEENKTFFRGFRMNASWGKNNCEYAFVIKTDGY